jgi:hypothetical protein
MYACNTLFTFLKISRARFSPSFQRNYFSGWWKFEKKRKNKQRSPKHYNTKNTDTNLGRKRERRTERKEKAKNKNIELEKKRTAAGANTLREREIVPRAGFLLICAPEQRMYM